MERTHPDDRAFVEQTLRAMLDDAYSGDELEYRIVGEDGVTRSLRMTVATLFDGERAVRRIVGSVQDVTAQRRLDRQLAAHVAVTRSLDDWPSLEHGAVGLLRRMAAAMEVPFGAFWIAEGSTLAARFIWHAPSLELEAVADTTRRWHPGLGAATLGRALATRQPVISADLSQGGSSDRRAAIHGAGLRGALALPAVCVDETLALLEFLSIDPIEPARRLTSALDGIGHELGHFLSHRRGELTAPVLTRRELEVLQLAALGRSAAAIAADLYLSRATVKRHFERAYANLDVSDRVAAVAEAMRRGLIV